MKIKFPIQLKLFFLLSGLTIAVLTTVLIAVSTVSSKTIKDDVYLDFAQLQEIFKKQQALRYQRILDSAFLVAENPAFKANVELKDENSVYFSVLEFANFATTDVIIITDEIGDVIAWYGRQDLHGTNIISEKTIAEALEGYYPEYEPEWPNLWSFEGEVYQTVSVPILKNNDIVIGSLTFGTRFTTVEAEELKSISGIDISLFLESDLVASSDESRISEDYWPFLLDHPGIIDSVLTNLVLTSTMKANLAGTDVLLSVSPLGVGEKAFIIATVPESIEFAGLAQIQQNLLLISAISIILIIALSVILGRIFSEPVKKLSGAMAEVSNGKFDVSVDTKTHDEIGVMAHQFNDMVIGLKERFALENYVGSHTLEMIKDTTQGKMELGGSRQELAILFTDIRGSTAKIEKTSPEDFINNLNKTLTSQAQATQRYNGSIDKFVGDSIIALFSGKNALEMAVRASIEMQREFYSDKELSGFFKGLGIGVNYGSMVLGNMGADDRMDYTVIGPEVNLCARLCSAAESGQILLPKNKVVEHFLSTIFNFREVDAKTLKGFSNPIETLEVVYD